MLLLRKSAESALLLERTSTTKQDMRFSRRRTERLPKYAGLDKVNPSSVILSGVLLLEHLGWNEAADLVIKSMEKTIASKVVTYDFARLMDGATEVKCSEFGEELIKNMD